MSNLMIDGPAEAAWTLILAHGAGVAMDAPFMSGMAELIAAHGIRVVRFEFPYMQTIRQTAKKRPPDREAVLLARFQEVIAAQGGQGWDKHRLVIGGKSLGGRMASLIAEQQQLAGLVVLGYPFHAPGKPDKPRIEHLRELKTPTLICQGDRDPFGTRTEIEAYPLSDHIRLHWLADGEHSFKPRKSAGVTEQENLASAANAVAEFITNLQE